MILIRWDTGGTHFGKNNSCLGEGTPIRAQRLQPFMAGTPLILSHGAQRCPTPVFSWPGQGRKITIMAGIVFALKKGCPTPKKPLYAHGCARCASCFTK